MTGTCICGKARLTLARKPDFIHDCNCTLCRKTGVAWGYFALGEVTTDGETRAIMRTNKVNAGAEVHSCTTPASTAYFVMAKSFTDKHGPIDMIGVNLRLFDQSDLKDVEVRFSDGAAWSGQGPFTYRKAPITLGASDIW